MSSLKFFPNDRSSMIRSPRTVPITLLVLIALLAASGNRVCGQSAVQLVDDALVDHPSLVAVAERVAAAEARARSLLAWSAPRIGVESRMLPVSRPVPFLAGETMLMAEQKIRLGDADERRADALRAAVDVDRLDTLVLQRRLLGLVAADLAELRRTDRLAAIERESREVLETLYREAKGRLRVDVVGSAPLYHLAAKITAVDAAIDLLDSERRERVERINILLGRPVDRPIVVDTAAENRSLPSFDAARKRLVDHPPVLRLVRRSRAALVAADAVGTLEPDVMLRAGVIWMPDGHPVRTARLGTAVGELAGEATSGIERLGLMVGASLSLPGVGWSRAAADEKATAARIEAGALLNEQEETLRDLALPLRSAYGIVERADRMIRHYRDDEIPLLAQQVAVVRSAWRVDRAELRELIDLYNDLLELRTKVVGMRVERERAIAVIEGLVGSIDGGGE